MYVCCNQKLLINIGTIKVRYRKYFEYSCTLNPDILVPISYTDACTISRWPGDNKIGCDGDDGGGDGDDVGHPEAFAFALPWHLFVCRQGFAGRRWCRRRDACMRVCVLSSRLLMTCPFWPLIRNCVALLQAHSSFSGARTGRKMIYTDVLP